MRVIVGLAVAAIAFLIPIRQSQAAAAAVCDTYVKEAMAKAQAVRAFDCGYDLNDLRWTTDRKSHARWCQASPERAVAKETAHRRGEMKICQTCRAYAEIASEAAAENGKLKCGYSGASWDVGVTAHFSWCMALRNNESAAGDDVAAAYKSIAAKIQDVTYPEAFDRRLQIVNCRVRGSVPPESLSKP